MNTLSSAVNKPRRRSILLVGNKTPALLALSLILRRFKYEIALAYTATQALELVSAVRPALIITDQVLSGMSSMDLLERIRQDKQTSTIPVVFLVSANDASAEMRCLDMGAAGCIGKPVQAEDLYRIVQAIIEPRPRANIRIDARLPVTLNDVPVDRDHGVCGIYLSEQGMYVPMYKPYPTHRRLSVKIDMADRTITAEGSVLYSHIGGTGPCQGSGMGLKFVDITPQDRECIRKFIRAEVTRDIAGTMA